MRKIYLLILLTIGFKCYSQNLELKSNLSYGSTELANIGGYVDTAGNEYALVGTYYGLDIVDVTDPVNPVIRFTVPDISSEWREVKTYRKFAYVTTEGEQQFGEPDSGLTIIDLSHLPDTVYSKHYMGDSTSAGDIRNQLLTIHALHCDTAKGFLYLFGSNLNSGNTLFFDLTDPWNPTFAGEYIFPDGGNPADPYVHDGYVENDTMYEAHIYSGFFAVVDVRDKANPVLLATQTTPTSFTHNTWLSDDHKTLFTTDENSNSFLAAYDISDLDNISELSRYQVTPGSGSLVHNTHILNDYAVTSWYTDGVVIVDEARPSNPIEIAHYDTYPQGGGGGYLGCWGVYPFLPSGNIVASDINNGLFVFKPTYVRGCYLEGSVVDSFSTSPINGALIEILTTTITKSTDGIGEFRTGTAVAGTYSIRISKPGYFTKTITGVQLTNGVLTQLNVLLTPLQTYAYSGNVTDILSGQPIPNAQVILEGSDLSYHSTADNNGLFSFPGVVPDTYTMHTGKWGYISICKQVTLVQGTPLSEALMIGYYDDFSFDFGWTVNGTSLNAWERADPIGSYDNNSNEINPENDVTSDCGTFCFVTDNGIGPYNVHDVDAGNTILTSPIFDASIYIDPLINYYYRFVDLRSGMNQPNDTLFVRITNGITTVDADVITGQSLNNGSWVGVTYPLNTLIPITNNMRVIVQTSDANPGNIVEGAFDEFEITGQLIDGIIRVDDSRSKMSVYPNPFNNEFIINYDLGNYNSSSSVVIKDMTGRIIESQKLSNHSGQLNLGKNLSAGIYLVVLENGNSNTVKKIVKE